MKCGLCDYPYNLEDRVPLVLPCGHTCCKNCLAQYAERIGHVQCPWDRERSSRSLEKLPKNFALIEAANLDQLATALGHGIKLDENFMLDERELKVLGNSLGRGATGQVLEGMYKDKPVAVKVVDIRGASPAFLETLQREVTVMLATAGDCRHICQYRGATIKGTDFCLVMRKYDKSLADVIIEKGAAGGLPIPRVLRYSRQILEALAELHAKKIIMGDLKPQNLLLHNLLDELVVTDFGLSRIVEHTLGAYRTSTVQGTPNYMPPECMGDSPITTDADMWSWACTVIHMATGVVPFGKLTSHQIIGEVRYGKKVPEIPANLPAFLQSLLQGCLSRDPASRPTVTQAIQAMEAAAASPLHGVSEQCQGPQRGQQQQQQQFLAHPGTDTEPVQQHGQQQQVREQQRQQQQCVAQAVQPRGDALKQMLLRSKGQLIGIDHGDITGMSIGNWQPGTCLTTWGGLTWGSTDNELLLSIKIPHLKHSQHAGFSIAGILPPSWSSLVGLGSLEIDHQQLTSELPSTWSALTSLTRMHVNHNQLSGSLPASWGTLAALKDLDLSNNELTGDLPPQWSALHALTRLCISTNQLTGQLPEAWSSLAALVTLRAGGNRLSGSLPPQWSALHNLQKLDLLKNQLIGSLPAEWSSMSDLAELWLSENLLSGSLPAQWSALSNLKELWLSHNQLSGSLPPEWRVMTQLTTLDLEKNQLSGEWRRDRKLLLAGQCKD